MWRYIAAAFFFLMGAVELLLALNGRLRETVMRNSLVRAPRSERVVLLLAGLSALALGCAILLYGLYW